uniref:Structure-specific endonuclease subunit SLX1 n=1 Tax=Sus scrofa TaxID=9823 RepID=A0A480GHJ5_PIG
MGKGWAEVGDAEDQVSSMSVQCSSSNSKSSSSSVPIWLSQTRSPHSTEFLQPGHWPSSGRSCPGSSCRNSSARQITCALREQPGWGQHRGPSSSWSAQAHTVHRASAACSGWDSDSVLAKGTAPHFRARARGGGGPKARGTCGGGGGQRSWRKSVRSQRRVSGRRAHGGTRSMCASTRRWKAKAASPRRRGPKWAKRREAFGCCQAHSNRRAATAEGKPCTMSTISLGMRKWAQPVRSLPHLVSN